MACKKNHVALSNPSQQIKEALVDISAQHVPMKLDMKQGTI